MKMINIRVRCVNPLFTKMKHLKFEEIPKESKIIHTLIDRSNLKKGCQFIREIGNKTGFPDRTVLTAQWYFRKFYQTRSLNSAPFLDIALTCTILASKVEESFEKIRSVLVTAFLILNAASFKGRPEDIKITEEHKNRVIQYERDVLIAVNFNFNLSHPHSLLITLAKSLGISKESAHLAWDLLDNWYEAEDFVLWEPPHILALSALKSVGEQAKVTEFAKIHSIKLINLT